MFKYTLCDLFARQHWRSTQALFTNLSDQLKLQQCEKLVKHHTSLTPCTLLAVKRTPQYGRHGYRVSHWHAMHLCVMIQYSIPAIHLHQAA